MTQLEASERQMIRKSLGDDDWLNLVPPFLFTRTLVRSSSLYKYHHFLQLLQVPLRSPAPMQTLWTRSLQARSSCPCPSCQSSLSHVGRHVNTAPARRRLRPDALAWYSTIIATAALADAHWKVKKREALDNAISEAKADVKATDEDQRKRLEGLGATSSTLFESQEEDLHTRTLRKIKALQSFDWSKTSSPHTTRDFSSHDTQLPLEATARSLGLSLEPRTPETGGLDQDGVLCRLRENTTSNTEAKAGRADTKAPMPDTETFDPHPTATGLETPTKSKIELRGPCHTDARKVQDVQVPRNSETLTLADVEGTPLPSPSETQKPSLAQNEMYRLLLGPLDINRGREAAEVWAENYTPPLKDRMRMLRETTNAKLVYTLLLSYLSSSECTKGSWPSTIQLDMPNQQSVFLSEKHKDELSQKICELGSRQRCLVGLRHNPDILRLIAPLPFPNYESMPRSERQAEANYIALQNDTLRDVFCQNQRPNTLFSKLCSILLAQKFAPNIHTYNLLIILLSRFQLYSSAMAVIDAMFEAGLKQNEVTFAAVLNCYHYASEKKKFWLYASQMNCEGAVGINAYKRISETLRAAHPDRFVDSHHSLKVFHGSYPSNAREKLVFAKAAKNMDTYEAIIIGWLNIGNFKKAMAEYSGLLRGGFRVSARILEAFLRYSVRIGEWEVGTAVWEQLKAAYQPLPAMTYYWMLQLCRLCQRSKEFDAVLHDGLHHKILRQHLVMDAFDLSESELKSLRNRSFACECLEYKEVVPGLELGSEPLSSNNPSEQLPNLYLMVTMRFLDLVEAKRKQQGWFRDRNGWAMKATKDIRARMASGDLHESQAWRRAMDLRSRLGNVHDAAPPNQPLSSSVSQTQNPSPLEGALPKVPMSHATSKRTSKNRSLTIDLSKPLDNTKIELLRSYLSGIQEDAEEQGSPKQEHSRSSTETGLVTGDNAANDNEVSTILDQLLTIRQQYPEMKARLRLGVHITRDSPRRTWRLVRSLSHGSSSTLA